MAEDLSPDAFETIRQLMRLVAENGLSELTIAESNGFSVTLKADTAEPQSAPLAPPGHPDAALPSPPPPLPAPAKRRPSAAPSEIRARSYHAIAMGSPMLGIFYRGPAPGEPAFVEVGDIIGIGSAIGLIEAMKVYSEVPSEVAGRIVEIAVENGELVQQGQPLLYVEPV